MTTPTQPNTTSSTMSTTLATAASPFAYRGEPDEDLKGFLEELNQYVHVHQMQNDRAAYLLRLSLFGKAKVWSKTVGANATYDQLRS
ncbi:hypothetical protein COBT_000452, partial [Conglomerata obtusa]